MTNFDKFLEIFGNYNDVFLEGCVGFGCKSRRCAFCEREDFWEREYVEKKVEKTNDSTGKN